MIINKHGFTLVELMIVVAIIGIMATMALPSYQDRVIRSQVKEALALATIAQDGVADYYKTTGTMPLDNKQAGLPASDKIVGNFTTSVKVDGGALEITLGNRINKHARDKVLTLRPAIVESEPMVPIAWVCGNASVPDKMFVALPNNSTLESRLLPIECRF